MTITGLIKLFVETKEGREGTTFQAFTTSISSKIKDSEEYINKSLEVQFSKDNFTAEQLRALKDDHVYDLDITDGWLKVRSYMKDEQEIKVLYIFVNKATLKGKKKIKKSTGNDDLPF